MKIERPAIQSRAQIRPAVGSLSAGAARVDITPRLGLPLGGFSVIAPKRAVVACGRLFANVLVIDDGRERVALVTLDLHAGSRYLAEAIAAEIPPKRGLPVDRIVLAATHTHYGPAGLYGDPMYDVRAGSSEGFDKSYTVWLAGRVAQAADRACRTLAPARIGFGSHLLWRHSHNKSLVAFRANGTSPSDFAEELAGGAIVPTLPEKRRAVDPRVKVLWAEKRSTREPIGAFATFSAHPCTIDPLRGVMSSDTFGHATRVATDQIYLDGRLWASGTTRRRVPIGLAVGPCADINVSLPSSPVQYMGPKSATDTSLSLHRVIGEGVGHAVANACLAARANLVDELRISAAFAEYDPSGELVEGGVLAKDARLGRAAAGASEFGRYHLLRMEPTGSLFRKIAIGFAQVTANKLQNGGCDWPLPDEGSEHYPKALLKGEIPKLIQGRAPDVAPLRVVKIGPLWVAAVPFELSVSLGRQLEKSLLGKGADHVLLPTVSGGYCSYATTPKEYSTQQYEGASTLWGRLTGAWLLQEIARLADQENTTRPTGKVEFHSKGKKRMVHKTGTGVRPDPQLRASLHGTIIRGSFRARAGDWPAFAGGAWLEVRWRPTGGSWKEYTYRGACATDATEPFLFSRAQRGVNGVVIWRWEWQMAEDAATELFANGNQVKVTLLPRAFCGGGTVETVVNTL